jgi:hypothetical protein
MKSKTIYLTAVIIIIYNDEYYIKSVSLIIKGRSH